MPLTREEQRAIDDRCELIAERVIERVLAKVIETHKQTCPHGLYLMGGKKLLVGFLIAASVFGAGSGATIASIIVRIMGSGAIK